MEYNLEKMPHSLSRMAKKKKNLIKLEWMWMNLMECSWKDSLHGEASSNCRYNNSEIEKGYRF